MFTTENSAFAAADLLIVNAAVTRLLAERIDDDTTEQDAAEIRKSVDDAVNNAWYEGVTADEIVSLVRGGHV